MGQESLSESVDIPYSSAVAGLLVALLRDVDHVDLDLERRASLPNDCEQDQVLLPWETPVLGISWNISARGPWIGKCGFLHLVRDVQKRALAP